MRLRLTTLMVTLAICVFAYSNVGSQESANVTGTKSPGTSSKFKDPLLTPARPSNLASKSLLNGIAVAGKRIVSVGARGHVVYSDDMGKTWVQSMVPVSLDLTAVYFPTPLKGWAVGQDGVILHSADGGVTWVKQLDGAGACEIMNKHYFGPECVELNDKMLKRDIKLLVSQGPVNPLLDVWFENESTGFVVGAFNLIFKTTDGGKTWEPWLDRTENPSSFHLYSIRPANGNLFIVGEQGLVLKYDPEARQFRSKKTPYIGTFFGILGNSDVVIAFGMRGNIYRSRDAGENWEKVESKLSDGILGGTQMSNGTIILAAQAGQLLISTNNGETFSKIRRETGLGIPVHSVAAPDPKTIVLASWTGVQVQNLP